MKTQISRWRVGVFQNAAEQRFRGYIARSSCFLSCDSGPLTQKCWAQETFCFGVMGVTTCSGLLQMVPAYMCCLSLIVHRPPFHF